MGGHAIGERLIALRGLGRLVVGTLGIYVVLLGTLGLVSQVVGSALPAGEQGSAAPYDAAFLVWLATPYVVGVLLPGVALLVLRDAVVLWLLGRYAVTDVDMDASALVMVGLALLGVYFAVSGFSGVVYGITGIVGLPEQLSQSWGALEVKLGLSGSLARLFLGLALVRWAPVVARRI